MRFGARTIERRESESLTSIHGSLVRQYSLGASGILVAQPCLVWWWIGRPDYDFRRSNLADSLEQIHRRGDETPGIGRSRSKLVSLDRGDARSPISGNHQSQMNVLAHAKALL